MADLKQTLTKLNRNLNTLREREAKYAGNAPLDLLNQITDHEQAIALTEQVIRGELIETEWHEAMKSLAVSLDEPLNIANLRQLISNIFSASPTQQRDLRNRQIMLQRVRDFWVKGVLENSLHNEVLLELGMEAQPEAVNYPWKMVLQRPEQPKRSLSPDNKIIDVFDESGGSLLILGEPGAGKTTMLLELARQLIIRAEQDWAQPIPVVFSLSSWVEKRLPLTEWLVEELNNKYSIPQKLAQQWVGNNELLLLLDSLDEVPQPHRDACVAAINAFEKDSLTPLVVCSRVLDYHALSRQLKLQGAVELQPLSPSQVEAYLAGAERSSTTVRQTLETDASLRDLARSPLMLSIMVLAYQELPKEIPPAHHTVEEQRRHIFDAYFDRILKRRGHQQYLPEQTRSWLAWLAGKMLQHTLPAFYIEGLQPSWLSTARQRLWYEIGIRLGGGIIFVLAGGLAMLLVTVLDASLAGGAFTAVGPKLMGGLAVGLKFGLAFIFGSVLALRLATPVAAILAMALTMGLAFVLDPAGELLDGLLFGLPGGVAGVTFASPAEINIDKTVNWSWPRALLALAGGLIIGLGVEQLWAAGWADALAIGLVIGLGAMLAFGAKQTTIAEETITPDQRLRQLRFQAMRAGSIVISISILFGVPIGLLDNNLTNGLFFGLFIGLPISLTAALLFGGAAYIQHFMVRLLLWYKGELPLHLVPFLDYAVECILLRKVGGGYIFIHRSLMEHFAKHPH